DEVAQVDWLVEVEHAVVVRQVLTGRGITHPQRVVTEALPHRVARPHRHQVDGELAARLGRGGRLLCGNGGRRTEGEHTNHHRRERPHSSAPTVRLCTRASSLLHSRHSPGWGNRSWRLPAAARHAPERGACARAAAGATAAGADRVIDAAPAAAEAVGTGLPAPLRSDRRRQSPRRAGTRTVNVLPTPGVLSTLMS